MRRCRHKVFHLAEPAPKARTVLTGINRLRTAIGQTCPSDSTVPTTRNTSCREWNPTARNGHRDDLSHPNARISS